MPVMPVVHRARDVRVLAAFVTAAQQQHDFGTRLGVIHAVASANVDAQFPYAVATKLVVAEVAQLNAADTFDYLHLGDWIAKVLEPIQVLVFAFGSEVVANFEHGLFSSINEYMSIPAGMNRAVLSHAVKLQLPNVGEVRGNACGPK